MLLWWITENSFPRSYFKYVAFSLDQVSVQKNACLYRKRCDLSSQILLGYTANTQTLEKNSVHKHLCAAWEKLTQEKKNTKQIQNKKHHHQIPKVTFYFHCLAKDFCSKELGCNNRQQGNSWSWWQFLLYVLTIPAFAFSLHIITSVTSKHCILFHTRGKFWLKSQKNALYKFEILLPTARLGL